MTPVDLGRIGVWGHLDSLTLADARAYAKRITNPGLSQVAGLGALLTTASGIGGRAVTISPGSVTVISRNPLGRTSTRVTPGRTRNRAAIWSGFAPGRDPAAERKTASPAQVPWGTGIAPSTALSRSGVTSEG